MTFQVLMTDDAAHDLEDIFSYIASNDSPEKADYALERIEHAILSLSKSPKRGVYPKELAALGIREYREIFFVSMERRERQGPSLALRMTMRHARR